jgi:uncharacterized membrane protein
MTELTLFISAFVLTHFLLSHPLRAPLVGKLGELGFLALYSVVAFATLIPAVLAYNEAPAVQLWTPPAWALPVGQAVMLFASILLAGAFLSPSPTMPMMGGQIARSSDPKGIAVITRHPMMWAFALWGIVHILVSGRQATLILAGGIVVLALVGARLQDGKKRAQLGAGWDDYTAKTSFVPFGKGRIWPGFVPVVAGVALFALLVWAHPLVIGVSTGLR